MCRRKSNCGTVNLHRARKSIHEMKHAVLMEGYFDAITAWQANVTNVVTTSERRGRRRQRSPGGHHA